MNVNEFSALVEERDRLNVEATRRSSRINELIRPFVALAYTGGREDVLSGGVTIYHVGAVEGGKAYIVDLVDYSANTNTFVGTVRITRDELAMGLDGFGERARERAREEMTPEERIERHQLAMLQAKYSESAASEG